MSTRKWDVPTGSNAAAALQPGACHTKCSRSPLPCSTSVGDVHPEGCFAKVGASWGTGSTSSVSVFLLFSVRLGLAVLGCQLVLTGPDDGACGRCAHKGTFGLGQVRPCLQQACGGRGHGVHAVPMSCVSQCRGAAFLRAFSLGVGHRGLAYVSVLNLEGCPCCRLQDKVWSHPAKRLTPVGLCLWRAARPWGVSTPGALLVESGEAPAASFLSLSCCTQGGPCECPASACQ